MKNKFIFAFAFLFCSVAAIAQKYGQQDYPFGRQQQQPSSWQGTGWAINNGYVVTNHHVVDGARTLVLKCVVGNQILEYNGEVTVTDEEHDLAIIRVTNSNFTGFGRIPYKLRTEQAEVGESVFVLGYPMVQHLGDEIKLSTGVVSSCSGYEGDVGSYQISAPIQGGNSGGPLFDEDGNVIGIVNAHVPGAENVGYAIKAIHLKNLISKLPSYNGIAPTFADLVGKRLPEQVRSIKSFVFVIYASTQGPATITSRPQYGAPSIPQGAKVIELPYVDSTPCMGYMRVEKVTITDKETIIEFRYSNRTNNGYYSWINISGDTYLSIGGQIFKMKSADGIAIAPNRTTFNGINDNKIFRVVFPAIPKGTTSFNFIEPGDSDWKFYGISLKE